ncbi:MAG TPA: hypothetical protein VHY34_02805 [Caulobacteraceae bacterium]|jgi:caa(3)-type oxidase subunit IV|nr:hypothetical protein [Caulobacteraceae bacterium]
MTRDQFKAVLLTPLVVWAALCLALTASALYAFLPAVPVKSLVAMVIAGFKMALIGAFFMRLDRASALVRITAAVGFVWLSFLFIFAFADYLTRAH